MHNRRTESAVFREEVLEAIATLLASASFPDGHKARKRFLQGFIDSLPMSARQTWARVSQRHNETDFSG
eukprot:2025378-Amphidinium_carterae.1